MDIGSIAAALASLKTAGEITKALFQLKSDTERQTKVIELQSVILAAQSSAISAQSDPFAMLDEVRKLKEEIAKVNLGNPKATLQACLSIHRSYCVRPAKIHERRTTAALHLCELLYERASLDSKKPPRQDTQPLSYMSKL